MEKIWNLNFSIIFFILTVSAHFKSLTSVIIEHEQWKINRTIDVEVAQAKIEWFIEWPTKQQGAVNVIPQWNITTIPIVYLPFV